MSEYKLIAFDLDGTLLDSKKRILPSSMEAIKEAVSCGKIVCIDTGRALCEIEPVMKEVPEIRYVVGASGGFIYDTYVQKYIFKSCMKAEDVKTIVQGSVGEDVQIVIMGETSYSQYDKAHNMAKYQMGAYQSTYLKVFELPENVAEFYLNNPFDTFKINFYNQNPAQREMFKKKFANLPLEVINSETSSLEITAKGVTKGSGLKELASFIEISLDEIIAVGDADNDIPMLEAAGFGIAMGNSNENVMRMADAVVSDNDSDGCAEAIIKYFL